MSKLTEAQKAANKADRKVRDAAYSARRKLYDAARKQAEAEHMASPEYTAAQEANTAQSALMTERNEGQDAIRKQIQALEAQLRVYTEQCGDRMAPLSEARSKAHRAESQARTERLGKVDERFPDVAHVYSVCGWKPELIPKD